jgi:hypothetical protein
MHRSAISCTKHHGKENQRDDTVTTNDGYDRHRKIPIPSRPVTISDDGDDQKLLMHILGVPILFFEPIPLTNAAPISDCEIWNSNDLTVTIVTCL